MAENNRTPRGNRPRLPWSIQQLHQNSHQIASSASQHIHELQDLVLQGLSPLIPTNVRGGNPPSHSHWFENPEAATVSQRNESMGDASGQEHFVIDMDSLTNADDHADGNTANATSPGLPDEGSGDTDQALRNSPEMLALISFAEKYLPFVLILLLQLIFDHRIGILVNLGLFITFCHANGVIKREVSKQGKRSFKSLLMVFGNVISSFIVTYSLIAERSLAYALVFIPPYAAPINFWEVLWIVSVTDFVLRLITILVKLFVVALPAKIIPFQRKGKYYLFMERSSQLYRSVIPMQHWLYFFSESYSGPSKVFGVILSATYIIFKVKKIYQKVKLWKKTLIKVLQSKTYGVTPSTNQIKETGDACPICQDDYKSPSMLQCKHIFCEECVALWFDRERTCPICRAQIADDPTWRDGSTTHLHQIF